MEKNVTLSVNMSNRETTKSIFKRMIGTWTSITQKVKMPAEWLRLYYSGILGKNITMQQTWLLIKAQTAFSVFSQLTCLFYYASHLVFGWFILSYSAKMQISNSIPT